MRITVQDVLEYLAGGMSEEEILSDFPELTRDDIRACLAFNSDEEKSFLPLPLLLHLALVYIKIRIDLLDVVVVVDGVVEFHHLFGVGAGEGDVVLRDH